MGAPARSGKNQPLAYTGTTRGAAGRRIDGSDAGVRKIHAYRCCRTPTLAAEQAPAEAADALSASSLFWGMVFGSIGVGFFVYGKKQGEVIPLLCGLALMIFPYFVSSTLLLVALGAVLIAIPFYYRN